MNPDSFVVGDTRMVTDVRRFRFILQKFATLGSVIPKISNVFKDLTRDLRFAASVATVKWFNEDDTKKLN